MADPRDECVTFNEWQIESAYSSSAVIFLPLTSRSKRARSVSFVSNSTPTESNSTRWFTKADSSGCGISSGVRTMKSEPNDPQKPLNRGKTGIDALLSRGGIVGLLSLV